eukprot:gene8513-1416_t
MGRPLPTAPNGGWQFGIGAARSVLARRSARRPAEGGRGQGGRAGVPRRGAAVVQSVHVWVDAGEWRSYRTKCANQPRSSDRLHAKQTVLK